MIFPPRPRANRVLRPPTSALSSLLASPPQSPAQTDAASGPEYLLPAPLAFFPAGAAPLALPARPPDQSSAAPVPWPPATRCNGLHCFASSRTPLPTQTA